MTLVLFVIAMVVAALGIPGAWSWVCAAPGRYVSFMAGISEPERQRREIKDPRALVPPPSPSGVVRPRPPGPSPIPTLGQLRQHAQDDIEAAVVGNQSTSALWANVNAARAAAAAAQDREPPPPPPPRPRWD